MLIGLCDDANVWKECAWMICFLVDRTGRVLWSLGWMGKIRVLMGKHGKLMGKNECIVNTVLRLKSGSQMNYPISTKFSMFK